MDSTNILSKSSTPSTPSTPSKSSTPSMPYTPSTPSTSSAPSTPSGQQPCRVLDDKGNIYRPDIPRGPFESPEGKEVRHLNGFGSPIAPIYKKK